MEIECGKSITVDVRIEDLPAPVMDHVIKIGLHNLLQDAHAGKRGEEAQAKVANKLEALYSGSIRVATQRRSNTSAQRELMQAMLEVWAKDEGLSKKRAEAIAKEMLAAKYSAPVEPVAPKPATKKRAA